MESWAYEEKKGKYYKMIHVVLYGVWRQLQNKKQKPRREQRENKALFS